MPRKIPVREQIRAAGGFYNWFNATLIRVAGPPQLGEGRGTPCSRCGEYKDDHVQRDDGLHCPVA